MAARVLVLVMLLIPRIAVAQPSWEIAGGYSYLDDAPDRTNFPLGWFASGGIGVTQWLTAVGDVSRHARSTLGIDLSTYAVLGGPRASARIGRVTEFGQVLVGLNHASSTVVGITSGDSGLAIQPGGGLDYPLSRRFAVRAQVDYRAIRGGVGPPIADPRHVLRGSAAIVYHGCCR
ncbi:MAG TPA: hypothetical protein VFA59_07340 [Vicinamibacterales bacterium]|nr:hypothetical protein [Vicinamibacterales bacterium]